MNGTSNTSLPEPGSISYLELVQVGTSDEHKPTYRQLRAEGMSEAAIETLMLSRDALTVMPAAEVAEWIVLSHQSYPLAVEDVWPGGTPDHWAVDVVGPDHDPTDEELAVAWNAPDAHVAHRAAWVLAQGIESGEVA